MWILIDNYDSFTFILNDYLKQFEKNILVFKNDEITIQEIELLAPNRIIISPGPKQPKNAGIVLEIIAHFHQKIPILGICLGHQALGQFFGAKLSKALIPLHGKTSIVLHNNNGVFDGIPQGFKVARYHSLIISELENTHLLPLAFTVQQELMAFQHVEYPCIGLQFHPESILTEFGFHLLRNWAEYAFQ